jgi:predicted neuraminidase
MDFDGDGDLDLVVCCPDKPSNGTYFFENPGGGKLPVFKPGKRISRGLHNVSPSYVDGRVRVLSPANEYPDFLKSGLEQPRKLKLEANIHPNKVRHNQWKHVDYDGDGRLDLIVAAEDWTDYGWDDAYDRAGRWTNGPLHGLVYVLRNTGNNEQPAYEKPVKVQAGGKPVDTYGLPSPNFADFDKDGDLDLLCGEFLDGFTYFENEGTRREPRYAAGRRLLHDGRPLAMDLEMIVPVAIDWDADGDTDLIVGDEDGRVALVENTGKLADRLPQFLPPRYFQQEADDVKFGALATPVGFDWDGDGDTDIISGNTAGYVGFIENTSGPGVASPKWAAPRLLEAGGVMIRIQAGPNGSIQGPCEAKWGYTSPYVADWDHDGLPDILINSIWGKIEWFRNIGTRQQPQLAAAQPIEVEWPGQPPKPAWNWWDPQDRQLVTQWRTTPVAVDWDGDKLTDLVMLDHEGFLALYRRQKNGDRLKLLPGERVFVADLGKPLQLNPLRAGKSGRRKLAAVDWDGDGLLDLLHNSDNANWLRQVRASDGRYLMEDKGPVSTRNISGHTTSPTTVDFNADRVPDLLVGAEDGRMYYALAMRQATASESGPAIVSSEFIYTEAPFPQCHASTLAETPQGLTAAWFGGTREKHPDVGIWFARRTVDRWTKPVEVANGVQADGKRHPCWNPVLYQAADGPLLLFYKVGPSPDTWWGMLITSDDGGRTWSQPRRLPEGVIGPVKNKPVRLPSGELLAGSSTEHNGWRVHFERSKDLGKTWEIIGPVHDGRAIGAIQPSILFLADGRLQAVGRSQQGRVFQIFSSDSGRTWGPMTLADLPNPNAGTDALTLADGRHLIVYNHTPRGRTPLNVSVSSDGQKWHAALVLESEPGEYSYPAVIQTSDGLVHVSYTWKRQRVKHVTIDPKRLAAREIVAGKWPGD